MSAVLKPVAGSGPSSKIGHKDGQDVVDSRRSKELIIGLSGPVGSGLDVVRQALERKLVERQYQVVHIKVSELFPDAARVHGITTEESPEDSPEFNRIWSLQNVGNALRGALGDDAAAQLAMRAIALHRTAQHPDKAVPDIVPNKVAYIVDQLKHPKEVALLRSVYRNLFFMIGVLRSYGSRKRYLTRTGMSRELAERLIARDRKESDENGQQLEKTLQHAEFFVSNSQANLSELEASIKRFVGLVHGDNGLTPTAKERGMFAAYSASLRSACLSRQVGAAITDVSGNVIATGCNDVPAPGGGLYEPGVADKRCVARDGFCHNDQRKGDLRNEVVRVLEGEGLPNDQAQKIADQIRSKTRIKDLIEFSRAVHAEMDAIISIARCGSMSIAGAIMYTTTYPCHSCARHIVAAGISKVYFIEPYEKSLAAELHDDSIAQETISDSGADVPANGRVSFLHFEGVAPRKFLKLFHVSESRKDGRGKAVEHVPDALKKAPEYLDDYRALESRVVDRLQAKEAGRGAPPSGDGPSAA